MTENGVALDTALYVEQARRLQAGEVDQDGFFDGIRGLRFLLLVAGDPLVGTPSPVVLGDPSGAQRIVAESGSQPSAAARVSATHAITLRFADIVAGTAAGVGILVDPAGSGFEVAPDAVVRLHERWTPAA